MELLELSEDLCPIPVIPEETMDLSFGGLLKTPLLLKQDGGGAGCGGKLWPAGDLLARYTISHLPGPHKVVELGSGTGLTGLALAKANPNVEMYITDQDMMMPLMQDNIVLNDLSSNSHAKILDWGSPLPEWCQGTDLVLAADCVYLEAAFALLHKTLLDLSDLGATILLCYKKRRKADRKFFLLIRKDFDIEEIIAEEYQQFRRDSVFLMKVTRKRTSPRKEPSGNADGVN